MRKTAAVGLFLCLLSSVPSSTSAATVTAGFYHTLVVKSDGTLWAFGNNGSGQLGTGNYTSSSTPVQVTGLTGVTAVAAGSTHSLALKSDGTVWAWGANASGQLGNGNTTTQNAPVQVTGLTGITAIVAGDTHSLALRNDGVVFTWGDDTWGQLGDGGTTARSTAYQVTGIGTVSAIGAGGSHTLAVLSTGAMKSWGKNVNGQLGNGLTSSSANSNPVDVSSLSGVTLTAGGNAHSLARTSNGNAWAWGYNGYGQLGDASTTQRLTAVQVSSLASVSAVAAGYYHSYFLKSDGTVWASGYNSNGQLGDGTNVGKTSPVQVAGLSGISAVAAGQYHGVAVATDGTVWAWGANANSQLGDGTTADRWTPIKVSDAGYAWKVGTPTFNYPTGTYYANLSVTVSCATSGATIRYTTDGTDPTSSSTQYTAPVSITQTATLKARAFKAGLSDSNVGVAVYTMKVATPTFSPGTGTYTTAQTVTITTTTTGSTIRYTTDGSDPTSSSTVYASPLSIGTTTTLKAKGFLSGWTMSDTGTATYTMNFGTLAAPTVSPGTGTYVSSVSVTLTASAGATIRYTTDGTDPTSGSTVYTAPLSLVATTTLKAKAFKVDYTTSATTTATYTIKVATPSFSVGSGTYPAGQVVTVTEATAGATVYYTINGNDPTQSDTPIASGGTLVAGNFTLKARAFKSGCTDSDVQAATYTVTGQVSPGGVAGGNAHSVVLKTDGTVWTFGSNAYYQLGDGTTVFSSSIAVQVVGLTGVKAIAAGDNHSLALRTDGTVWAWGVNGSGQLGDNTQLTRNRPVQVSGLANAVSIGAGGIHSIAARADGTVWVWGSNASGQLGSGGTPAQSLVPLQVSGLAGITAVAAGGSHSLAGSAAGLWAWGLNGNGQLGDGTTTNKLTPVLVDGMTGVTDLRASLNHSQALRSDGTVWGWGSNALGELGDGTTAQRTTPVPTVGLTGVVSLATGYSHGLVAKSDGTVWGWGQNGNGQLGDGTGNARTSPAQVSGLSAVTGVGAGAYHSLALTSDGTVWAWGGNGAGQIGDGTAVQRSLPTKVAEPAFAWKVGTPTFSVAPGTYFANQTVALACATAGATIRYTTDGTDPTAASTLYSSALSITVTTTLKARGFKAGVPDSNVGMGVYTLQVTTPTFSPAGGSYTSSQTVTVSTTTSGATIRYTTDGSDPTSASTLYTAPVSIPGSTTLKAKGFKSGWADSATGTATYTINFGTLAAPTLTPGTGIYITSQSVTMSAASGTTIRYTTDGTDPTSTSTAYPGPVTVSVTTTLKAKAFKPDYTLSATTTATYTIKVATPAFSPAAGTYSAGQAVTITGPTPGATIYYTINGNNPTTSDGTIASGSSLTLLAGFTLKAAAFKTGCTQSDVQTAAYTVTGQVSGGGIAAGEYHSLVRPTDGTMWSWGKNVNGQLGDGSTTNRFIPTQVGGLTSVVPIAAGQSHTLARKSDGTAWAWGSNSNGQLGDNTTTDRLTPVQVSGLTGVTAVAAGATHSLAVKSDGTVWAWGRNNYGQLGDNTTTDRWTPVQVASLSNVTAVAAGQYHSLALKADGTVWAWGYNASGQLGDNTTTQRQTPVQVTTLTGATSIAAGSTHSLAVKSDKTVWAWGANSYGQLGDNTTIGKLVPVQVSGLTGALAVAGGQYHSLAARVDGSVWAWGYGYNGELGNGLANYSATPVQSVGLTNIIGVAAGASHSLAIASDGSVWSWGANVYGQLGDGTTTSPRTIPGRVSDPGFAWHVGTPTMSPAGAAYTAVQNVVVSCVTSGATIYYTTNGVDPTQSDATVVSGGTIVVGQSLTLKAKAWKSGLVASNVGASTYTLTALLPTATPAAGTYNTAQSVTLSSTPGAAIRYTTDGTDPTDTSTLYTGAISVGATTTLKAIATKSGWLTSGIAPNVYTLKVQTPTVSPAGGNYGAAQTVAVSVATAGAILHYTTNGAEPSANDLVISSGGTLVVDHSQTLKAKAWMNGWTESDAVSATYNLTLGTVATPTLSPATGTYTVIQTVIMTTATPGAAIRYTTNGIDPTLTSRLYVTPLQVDTTVTVKAKAFKADSSPSATATATYTVNLGTVAPLTLSISSGPYATAQSVTISTATAGATIRYTTTGVDPTTSDTVIASGGSFLVNKSMVLKAKAWKTGLPDSPVRRADYTITGAVAGGTSHSLALKSDGTAWAWGSNTNGQIGDGTSGTNRTSPVQVSGLTTGVAIAGGGSHSVALKGDGTVVAWGSNANGQLGDGSTTQRTSPVAVSGLASVVAIAAGGSHTLALKGDGTVWAWGANSYGQLGNGTTTQSLVPVQVSGLTSVVAIAAGLQHSLALKQDGTVWAWGDNTYGQIGDGTVTQRTTPVQATALAGVVAIRAGSYHSVALKTDGAAAGTLWAWGQGTSGQLGDGAATPQRTPAAQVSKLGSVITFAVGASHNLALIPDGKGFRTTWVWGFNGDGQLGDATYTQRNSAVRNLTLSDVVGAAGGGSFVLALRRDASVWAWGRNTSGELGDAGASGPSRNVPGAVPGLSLADASWLSGDPDLDGLSTGVELALGTDPLNADTNGDGIADGVSVGGGTDPANFDQDGDGVLNATELQQGTDPFRADTDGDGVNDGADCFPLDATRWQCPTPTPGDTTPPVITLTEPTNAVLISSVP